MKKVTITIVLIFLLAGCLELSGCTSGLSTQDKIAIAESAVDATRLEGDIAKMDPNLPQTGMFAILAQKEGARALRLVDHIVNGTDPNEWEE